MKYLILPNNAAQPNGTSSEECLALSPSNGPQRAICPNYCARYSYRCDLPGTPGMGTS